MASGPEESGRDDPSSPIILRRIKRKIVADRDDDGSLDENGNYSGNKSGYSGEYV